MVEIAENLDIFVMEEKMTEQKLRVGIIGTGKMAAIHTKNLKRIPGVEVVIVGSRSITFAGSFAERYDISDVGGYDDVLANHHELDAVVVASTADTHPRLIEQAAENGLSIFCEKPLGNDLPSIDKALAAVKRGRVLLLVGFNRRYDPLFQNLRYEINKARGIWQLRLVSRDPCAPSPENLSHPLALISETMVHDLDMACFLGGSVESISVIGGALINPDFKKSGQIDTALASLSFESGATCAIENCWWAHDGYDQRAEVHVKGAKTAQLLNPTSSSFAKDGGLWVLERPVEGFFSERYAESYEAELQAFVHHVLQLKKGGDLEEVRARIEPSAEDARYTAVLVEAAKASYRNGGARVQIADFL